MREVIQIGQSMEDGRTCNMKLVVRKAVHVALIFPIFVRAENCIFDVALCCFHIGTEFNRWNLSFCFLLGAADFSGAFFLPSSTYIFPYLPS